MTPRCLMDETMPGHVKVPLPTVLFIVILHLLWGYLATSSLEVAPRRLLEYATVCRLRYK